MVMLTCMIRETGRNATRCNLARGAQHKEKNTSFIRVIISITIFQECSSRNFFYNSPISTVVIILPSQAMHMLRANHSKLSFCGAWSRQAHLCRGAWCAVTGIAAAGRCHPPLVLVVCPNETCWDEHVWFDFVNLSIQGRKCKDACSHNPRCPKVMHTS